ncbi:SDR family NAD(P)-dependent oxidoreductase [Chloroflexota bacterium]
MTSPNSGQRLKEKVAIVTGGAHGIGKAYCMRLADEGASVVVADINKEQADIVVKTIEDKGGNALATRTDISDPKSTDEMAKQTIGKFGKIDILVNNAAIFGVVPISRVNFWDISLEDWNKVMAANITGTFLCIRSVLPYMRASGGKIINQSSAAFHAGLPNFTHYIASRGAIIGMTRSMARELGQFNINVNSIAPGATFTPEMVKNADEAALQRQKATIAVRALKRIEYPEDLVGALIFLASSDSDFVTGQTMIVDGGAVMI